MRFHVVHKSEDPPHKTRFGGLEPLGLRQDQDSNLSVPYGTVTLEATAFVHSAILALLHFSFEGHVC